MHLGIISDTHGQVEAMAAAVRLLRAAGAQYFIHCGDVGGPGILDCLAGLEAAFVWGNTDGDRKDLQSHARIVAVQCMGAFAELKLDGKDIAVLHGDDHRRFAAAVEGQRFDYLFCGHTHACADWRQGRTRIVNPGALHRAARKTVALLDTRVDELRLLVVGGTDFSVAM